MAEPKKGELFSRQYVERGKPLPDSARFRVRLSQWFNNHLYKDFNAQIAKEIPSILGVEVPYITNVGFYMPSFIKEVGIVDLLSAITVIYRQLSYMTYERGAPKSSPSPLAHSWRNFVATAFKEENLAYTVDDECGIHPLVDMEYERNIASAIAGLGLPRYKAALVAFQAAQAKLEQNPVDTKGAIRDIFEAAETLTKLITSSGKSLDAGFVRGELEPRIQRHYERDPVARRSSLKAAQSFADWIDSAHPYRHGHEAEEPVAPPLELAVLVASQGASFIRWLVELDALLVV